jgi:hypothetical protein
MLSANRNLQLPHFALKLMQRFLPKERSLHLIDRTNTALSDLCKMSREHFNSRASVKVFTIGIGMTFIAFLFQGISFLVLANAVGERVGLLESLMATSASTALSTLPITIGGSGLAELGIWAYISNLNGIPHIADILKASQLSVIIAWRIATYHIPLVIMWICLMKITIGKNSKIVRVNGTPKAVTNNEPDSSPKKGYDGSISNHSEEKSHRDIKSSGYGHRQLDIDDNEDISSMQTNEKDKDCRTGYNNDDTSSDSYK